MSAISKSTANNWNRLHVGSEGKLTRRANKTLSRKRVVASSYLEEAPAHQLLSHALYLNEGIGDIIYTLCRSYLSHCHLLERAHASAFLQPYTALYHPVHIDIPAGVWDSGRDVLGFIYQSLTMEGQRNQSGLYYTHRKVAEYMVSSCQLREGETFLDPCCGSGAFLLSVSASDPSNLYGIDTDPIAVMIAGTNLLARYAHHTFTPQVYCIDFLRENLWPSSIRNSLPAKFDHIYTNPPWGVDKAGTYHDRYPAIKSRERSSMMLAESLRHLNERGDLYFLQPMSLLRIKTHIDVRKHILTHAAIRQIDLFADRFDGVFTDYFAIRLSGAATTRQEYTVTSGAGTTPVCLSKADMEAGRIITEPLTPIEEAIIRKMESLRHDDLRHSRWALGIVTGDNQSMVSREPSPGWEPIYTGRQVHPFRLHKATSYIRFEPSSFQQCAKEGLYRAPEKLIYRFIARHPIVAYDDRQCLCLNSANILIPHLDSISIKSVAALLNSSLYHFYYSTQFKDIKVLKGNLQALPFPHLTHAQDDMLSRLATEAQQSDDATPTIRMIDDAVYSIFGITPEEIATIRSRI